MVSIPRCYHPHDFCNIARLELHPFSGASCVGNDACSYLRYINDKEEIHCIPSHVGESKGFSPKGHKYSHWKLQQLCFLHVKERA